MGRSGLDKDRKFLRLARALNSAATGYGEILARGVLETLWSAAYERADDHIGDADDVEIAAKWPGVRGALVEALLAAGGGGETAGFIEPDPDRGGYRVHDLWDHAPPWVRRKAEAEAARAAAGKTLADVRREAGRKGRARQLAGKSIPVAGQKESSCPQTISPGKGREGIEDQDPPIAPPSPGANGDLFGATPPPAPAPLDRVTEADLEAVYRRYPRKDGKSPGMKIARRDITTRALLDDLRRAVGNFAGVMAEEGREAKYIMHFGTFMGRWRDYLEVAPSTGVDQRGPLERAMDEYHGARERLRADRGEPGDAEIVSKWKAEH